MVVVCVLSLRCLYIGVPIGVDVVGVGREFVGGLVGNPELL